MYKEVNKIIKGKVDDPSQKMTLENLKRVSQAGK